MNYHKQYYQNNKEKLAEYYKEYRKKNIDHIKEYEKKYKDEHREKYKEYYRKRYANIQSYKKGLTEIKDPIIKIIYVHILLDFK